MNYSGTNAWYITASDGTAWDPYSGRGWYITVPPQDTGLTVDEGTRRLVLHDVSCPHCRRFFCQVWAPEGTVLKPACEGCEREGRGSL